MHKTNPGYVYDVVEVSADVGDSEGDGPSIKDTAGEYHDPVLEEEEGGVEDL